MRAPGHPDLVPTVLGTRRVRSTGGELALHDFGGEGPGVLICHATGFHGRAYGPFARALREHHQVWGLDFRSHGASDRADDLRWSSMASDLLAVLDHLAVPDINVVGHSLGGAATLLAAQRSPGRIRRAWLFEPIVFPTNFRHIGGAHPLALGARRRAATFSSRPEAFARYATSKSLGRLRADALWDYVRYGFRDVDGGVTLCCSPDDEAAVFEADVHVTVDRVESVDLTTEIVHGRRVPQAFGPHSLAAGLAERLPAAALRGVDGVGHLGPLEDPDTTAELAAAFFASR